MSISLLAAAGATLAALLLTLLLVLRRFRVPQVDLAAWLCAAGGLTVALAAQAVGYSSGFGPDSFRAVQIGALLIAPVALMWALAEVAGSRAGVRFAVRLALAALTVIAGVILATDPLGAGSFSTAWPAASAHYQILPTTALTLVAIVTVITAVVAVTVTAVRARRDEGWQDPLPAVAAAAVAALLTVTLRVALPLKTGYPLLCLIAVTLTWYAGSRAGRVDLAALHEGPGADDDDWGDYRRYRDEDRYRRYRADTGGFGPEGADTGYGMYRADTGGFGPEGADTGYGMYQADTGGFGPGTDTGYGRSYREPGNGSGQDDPGLRGAQGQRGPGVPDGIVQTGDMLPVDGFAPPRHRNGEPDGARLYGQIAIYTLLDGHADEFDRLARQVVADVVAHEPGTLIYVMHSVPSAPMQRILYEVYQDEAAFADHGRQPHVRRFEEGREPYVLATNVIELAVDHAKVRPLQNAPYPPSVRRARTRGNGAR